MSDVNMSIEDNNEIMLRLDPGFSKTDPTLTIPGIAADAKATGDRFATDELKIAENQSNLSSEIAERRSSDNNLQTQIDEIIAPSGEAPSAAEVTNARIGADSTVYPTLGEAIRTQITDLKSGLTFQFGKNLIGTEPYKIYPCFIPAGTKYTFSTSDGQALGADILLHLYYEDGTTDYWTFRSSQVSRTVDDTKNIVGLSMSTWPRVPIQVEIGAQATAYEPHIDNVREINTNILSIRNICFPMLTMRNGSMYNGANAEAIATASIIDVSQYNSAKLYLSFSLPEGYKYGVEFSTFSIKEGRVETSQPSAIRNMIYYVIDENVIEIPFASNEVGFAFALYAVKDDTVSPLRITTVDITKINIELKTNEKYNKAFPTLAWRNGSELQIANTTAIALSWVLDVSNASSVNIFPNFKIPEGYHYGYQFCTYRENSGNPVQAERIRTTAYVTSKEPFINIPLADTENGFCVSLWCESDSSSATQALRVSSLDVDKIIIQRNYDSLETDKEIEVKNNNARHVINGGSVKPLTFLHFSDPHADVGAVNRIIAEGSKYSPDEIICTGDMVQNSESEIASWWNPKVLTVIGNHDTASYSEGQYDWTALSMADRDAYYIAPFESNWGIVHASGTSYYYKDYTESNVRLIALDAMLYMAADTSQGDAQTAWLSDLLDDAKTNGYHVLIAVHTVSGGSTRVDCTFSGLDWATMPTYGDCNLPNEIVTLLKTKIDSGLVFIGYLAGHFHQDMVWEKQGQYGYVITCAGVSPAHLWAESDQHRGVFEDAYNLFTIDTVHGLVKIVRGGGADVDMYMRPRKMICFDYINHVLKGQEA